MYAKSSRDHTDLTASANIEPSQIESHQSEVMTKDELLDLGVNDTVYINEINPDRAELLFPEVDEMPEDTVFYAVHAANGTPILFATDLQSAILSAKDHDLKIQLVS